MEEERVDILDRQGNLTGKTALKSEAHANGWFHPTVHIWFYTADGRILLQQRAQIKDTHPLLWDVSVAGHIGSGEIVEEAAVREVEEEIGLAITTAELQKIGYFRGVHKHGAHLIDCEYHHTFIARLKVPLAALTKQESEVEDLALIPITQFAEEVWGLARPGKYVPHAISYYREVIRAIKERL